MKAVLLDRDGVVNEDRDDYVKNIRELRVFPQVPDCIKRLNDAGYRVIVVSNQQGVAKGLISEDDLQAIEDEITRQVASVGAKISGFYYCKHLSSQHCSCRKPRTGMLTQAAREHGIDLNESFLVGDTEKDMIAGKGAGCKTVLVLTGSITADGVADIGCRPDYVAKDLAEGADYILGQHSPA